MHRHVHLVVGKKMFRALEELDAENCVVDFLIPEYTWLGKLWRTWVYYHVTGVHCWHCRADLPTPPEKSEGEGT